MRYIFTCAMAVLTLARPAVAGQSAAGRTAQAKAPAATVNLNTASQSELEALPGIGAPTAKKIIAARPYASVADLAKAGVPQNTIQKIMSMVTVGGSARMPSAPAAPAAPRPVPVSAAPVNVNTASQADLVALPGIGAATARKIVAGRPYASVADLATAGVPRNTLEQITPMITVGAAARMPATPPAPRPAPAPAAPVPPASRTESPTTPRQPPVRGMVWVNLSTKVFHREGDRFYGNTKRGTFMTEADALRAGYRETKSVEKPKL